MSGVVQSYPGSGSSVAQMLGLADEYFAAAMLLIRQEDPLRLSTFAPARLCVLQAIEVYLNAFLLFHGVTAQEIRTFQHGLARRAEAAQERGLRLEKKTLTSLAELEVSREYLLVRYAPERGGELIALPRLFSTLDDVTRQVRTAILQQPFAQDDPSFKRYW